jgi:hypothetical protein
MSTISCPTFVDIGSNHSIPTRVIAIVNGAGDTLLEAVVKYSFILVLCHKAATDGASVAKTSGNY